MAKAAGKHHHEIAHLHGCTRKNCHNITAVCIDVGDEHLGIQPHHVNQWSQAIEDGHATLQAPPPDLITKMKYATQLGANHAAQAKKKEKKHHRSSSSSSLSSSSTSHVSKKACQSSQPSIQNIYTTPAMSSMPPNDMMSAKRRSIRRKMSRPKINSPRLTPRDTPISDQLAGVPSKA